MTQALSQLPPQVAAKKPRDEEEINLEKLVQKLKWGSQITPVDKGSHSTVYRVEGLQNRVCALKVMREYTDPLRAIANSEGFKQEVQFLSELGDEPYFPKLVDHSTFNKRNIILMSYHPDTLEKAIPEMRHKRTQFVSCVVQLFRALEILKSRKIVHLDIKPSNIFFNQMGLCTLGDFGNSHKEAELSTTSKPLTTLWYEDPRYRFFPTERSYSSDIWGLGCLICTILTSKLPLHTDGAAPALDYGDPIDFQQRLIASMGSFPKEWEETDCFKKHKDDFAKVKPGDSAKYLMDMVEKNYPKKSGVSDEEDDEPLELFKLLSGLLSYENRMPIEGWHTHGFFKNYAYVEIVSLSRDNPTTQCTIASEKEQNKLLLSVSLKFEERHHAAIPRLKDDKYKVTNFNSKKFLWIDLVASFSFQTRLFLKDDSIEVAPIIIKKEKADEKKGEEKKRS